LRIAPVLLGPHDVGLWSRSPAPSGLQAGLLALGSIYSRRLPGPFISNPVAVRRFRPQLQRRDRDGFAPSSLFSPEGPASIASEKFSRLPRPCQGKSPLGSRGGRREQAGVALLQAMKPLFEPDAPGQIGLSGSEVDSWSLSSPRLFFPNGGPPSISLLRRDFFRRVFL
jgi:hypothetical protein